MWPDERLLEESCSEKGCPYWTVSGYIFCEVHLWGPPERLPRHLLIRKLKLEKEASCLDA